MSSALCTRKYLSITGRLTVTPENPNLAAPLFTLLVALTLIFVSLNEMIVSAFIGYTELLY
jgi:hypothetical protein